MVCLIIFNKQFLLKMSKNVQKIICSLLTKKINFSHKNTVKQEFSIISTFFRVKSRFWVCVLVIFKNHF